MSLMVDYCPRCGSVYQKNLRNMCNGCREELDGAMNRCLDHLWRSPKSTTEELSQVSGIGMQELYQFIQAGKFSHTYINLTFPCECCQKPIRQGRLCDHCVGSFREAFPTPVAAAQPAARAHGAKTSQKTLYTSRTGSRY
ncbi:hypothetical protein [Paenibacillus campi]|uniref:hypothetical protein n=1 Tax=Paenibacillus campi TaxID=3106031 RepID=UPI002AFFB962|nr:hypothetical protein [Paenibacillus sp. SGZ-1014]